MTGTFDAEASLPRVPLPSLQESCERLLAWSAPVLTAEQQQHTAQAMQQFLAPGSPAHALHAAIEEKEARGEDPSWLEDFWRDRYLGRRDRIALNANFFFLFRHNGEGQVARAASLVMGALAYKRLIDTETLPPATQRGQVLSMEQNKYLFSSTRIPGDPRDTTRTPYSREQPGPSRARHILVAHQGHFVRLDVLGADGTPHSLAEIEAGLQAVLSATPGRAAPGHSVGHLTTQDRAVWAMSREVLIGHSARNRASLEDIETALLCVCLEDSTPETPLIASDQLLHGDSANRWFDTAVSFIVFEDGTAGYNGEHCNLDGTTVIACLDHVLAGTGAEHEQAAGARSQGVAMLTRLAFDLSPVLQDQIQRAGEDFTTFANATATTTVSLDFSAQRAKALGVSPDAFAQLAFQVAQVRARGHLGTTYESIATRTFRHGRTEAMRVVTPEVVAMLTALADPDVASGQRAERVRAAAAAHVTRARQCQAGEAPEQHLWEIQMLARRQGVDLGPAAALYSSPGWTVLREDYLSTSAVPSSHVTYWGFGSTSETCIGVGYAMLPDRFDLYLSTPMSVRPTMMAFADQLPIAVAELETLLQQG